MEHFVKKYQLTMGLIRELVVLLVQLPEGVARATESVGCIDHGMG
jgi:hypothetical protein